MKRKSYETSFKYKIIESRCNGMSVSAVSKEYGISLSSVLSWQRKFIKDGVLGNEQLSKEEKEYLEKLREKAVARKSEFEKTKKSYEDSFKYKVIEEFCNGKTAIAVGEEYGVSYSTVLYWQHDFVRNGAFNDEMLSGEEKTKILKLREKAIRVEDELKKKKGYKTSFKYRLIEEICNGKKIDVVAEEYSVTYVTALKWLRVFVKKGTLGDEILSNEEKKRIEQLRMKAIKITNETKRKSGGYETSFKYQLIEELCNGKTATYIAKEYGVSYISILNWLRDFVQNGALNEDKLSFEEKLRIEQLREKATEVEPKIKKGRRPSRLPLQNQNLKKAEL